MYLMQVYKTAINTITTNSVCLVDCFSSLNKGFSKNRTYAHKYLPYYLENHAYSHKRYFHFHAAEIQNA